MNLDSTAPSLSKEALAVLREEEALANRTRHELLMALQPDPSARAEELDLWERMRSLRDDASSARLDDLSALFDQMHTMRIVAGRAQQKEMPSLDSPYFAHLVVEEDGKLRDYLLGRTTFIVTKANLRIVDWRHAPIARLFYLYREGDDFEERFPGKMARGVIAARRVVSFRKGQLQQIATPDFTLQRSTHGWQEIAAGDRPQLEGGEGTAVRGVVPDVTALLDRDQYEALESHGSDPLLLVGGAGSGKTTVALHRCSALAYRDPQNFRQNRMRVIVPEEGLARLTRRLLEGLGTPQIRAETFARFARNEIMRLAPKLPRQVCEDTPTSVVKLKQHPALLALLPKWVARKRRRKLDLASDRAELFTDKALLQEVVRNANGELPASAALDTVRHTLRQLQRSTEEEFAGTDEERLVAIDGLGLDERTSDDSRQSIDEEDDAVLLEIARLRAAAKQLEERDILPRYDHVVVDEAQESSAFALSILGSLTGKDRSLTIAGDEAQRMDYFGSLSSWEQRLTFLGVPEAASQELRISYRSSHAIGLFAHQVLGDFAPKTPPQSTRQGRPVERFAFSTEGELVLFLMETLQDLVLREPDASVAVLTRTAETAAHLAGLLQHVQEARLVEDGEFSFAPGIDICEVSAAKGLEFDYVIAPDVSQANYPDTAEARRTLHVAATRAIHQLWVLAVGRASAILPSEE